MITTTLFELFAILNIQSISILSAVRQWTAKHRENVVKRDKMGKCQANTSFVFHYARIIDIFNWKIQLTRPTTTTKSEIFCLWFFFLCFSRDFVVLSWIRRGFFFVIGWISIRMRLHKLRIITHRLRIFQKLIPSNPPHSDLQLVIKNLIIQHHQQHYERKCEHVD